MDLYAATFAAYPHGKTLAPIIRPLSCVRPASARAGATGTPGLVAAPIAATLGCVSAGSEAVEGVVDVTDSNFERAVIEESNGRPVVVDFWADWCMPCRALSPVLEKLAAEHKGAFLLAKMDTDANPRTSGRFGIQSIPTVMAFSRGKVVDQFLGAVPEHVVSAWLRGVLPSEADDAATRAQEDLQGGDAAGAERAFRKALESDPENRDARLGLAQLLIQRNELEEARVLIAPLLPDTAAERVAAQIRVADWKNIEGPGTLASAKRLAARERYKEALDGMLGALGDDPSAREAMLDLFAVLGDDHPLTKEYRAKLASTLFG